MKLFRQLLVAPALLGLLAPIASNASEFNVSGINSYSNLEQEEEEEFFHHNSFNTPLVNNEVNNNLNIEPSFEAGSFSDTTVATQSASFLLSGGEGDSVIADEESFQAMYYYGMALDTSFTGEDNLNVVIETGNNTTTGRSFNAAQYMDYGSGNNDLLQVVDLNYTRSFGDLSVTFGDSLDASAQYSTACAYSGFTDHLADCGTGLSAGLGGDVSLSTSYDFGNGVTTAIGVTGAEGASTDGIFTKESVDAFGGQVAYAGDSYGFSVSYANIDSNDASGTIIGVNQDATVWGFNGYYSFDSLVDSVSLGYQISDMEDEADRTNWFAGVATSEIGPGSFSVGLGTTAPILEGSDETMQYEASYSWDVNDATSMSLGGFRVERAGTSGQTQTKAFSGVALSTTFSF